MIREFKCGNPGSCHDRPIFESLDVYQDPTRFFTPGEFLLGDSAYGLSQYMLTPYRSAEAGDDQQPRECCFQRKILCCACCSRACHGIAEGSMDVAERDPYPS